MAQTLSLSLRLPASQASLGEDGEATPRCMQQYFRQQERGWRTPTPSPTRGTAAAFQASFSKGAYMPFERSAMHCEDDATPRAMKQNAGFRQENRSWRTPTPSPTRSMGGPVRKCISAPVTCSVNTAFAGDDDDSTPRSLQQQPVFRRPGAVMMGEFLHAIQQDNARPLHEQASLAWQRPDHMPSRTAGTGLTKRSQVSLEHHNALVGVPNHLAGVEKPAFQANERGRAHFMQWQQRYRTPSPDARSASPARWRMRTPSPESRYCGAGTDAPLPPRPFPAAANGALSDVPPPPPPFPTATVVPQQPAMLVLMPYGQSWPSCGSVGHPNKCNEACKYAKKPRGCKDGAACDHCHICDWKKVTDSKKATDGKKGQSGKNAGRKNPDSRKVSKTRSF